MPRAVTARLVPVAVAALRAMFSPTASANSLTTELQVQLPTLILLRHLPSDQSVLRRAPMPILLQHLPPGHSMPCPASTQILQWHLPPCRTPPRLWSWLCSWLRVGRGLAWLCS